MDSEDKSFNRRGFIKKLSSISLVGLGISSCNSSSSQNSPIKSEFKNDDSLEDAKYGTGKHRKIVYRSLGSTGLKASDISFGAGGIQDPRVVIKAMELGINYFDTAPDYGSGRSERVLGKAFKASKIHRDKYIIATKMCSVGGYPRHYYFADKPTYIKGVEDSLNRLNTDYIDFLFVHALGERNNKEISRLKDPNMLEAFYTLKKQGKVRFLAVSSHSYPSAIGGGLDYAIDSGHFKLIMTAYSYDRYPIDKYMPKIKLLAKKAYDKGVAFVAMKTLKGAKGVDPNKLRGHGTFAQAAFKWVLSDPNVSNLVVTMKNMSQVNQYIKASGKTLTYYDREILRQYGVSLDKECQIGCYDCESACPKGINIADILRYNMYFTNYGEEKESMLKYNDILSLHKADKCSECDSPCEYACLYGVSIRDKLVQAHNNLAFS